MAPSHRLPLLALACAALAACFPIQPPQEDLPPLTGFEVNVLAVQIPASPGSTSLIPAPVVTTCEQTFDGGVPDAVRGTAACPYAITANDVDFTVDIRALTFRGAPLTTLNRTVAFRVVPGDLSTDQKYKYRFTTLNNGVTLTPAHARANHLYSQVRVWVEDAPPEPIYTATGTQDPTLLPSEENLAFPRTYATGVSQVIYFEDPTLAKLQFVSDDNRTSPFINQFVTVGRPPSGGPQIVHNCPDDPAHNGQPVSMVVTGIDSAGFFLTDINSCRIRESSTSVGIPEPGGFYPGTFGSIYVYNYSHPDALDEGDLLWSVSGSMQEFTSTTQLTFAAWNVAERVREPPHTELDWNKWLGQVPIVDVGLRACGLGLPNLTDTLCGNARQSLKLESLESTLVRLRNVKLPNAFAACDKNADGEVSFFCDYTDQQSGEHVWGQCPSGPPTGPNAEEVQCYIDCTNSLGQYTQTVCTERTAFANFNQITVEMNAPGPASAGLDESVGRIVPLSSSGVSIRTGPYAAGQQVSVVCNKDVYYRLGDTTVTADATGSLLAANTVGAPFFSTGVTHIAVVATDGSAFSCSAAVNPRVRFLTTLHDVAPDLVLECDPSANTAAGEQCRFLQGATYDIVGHLRHVQPARPRWMVMPRDLEDVCCHPKPGVDPLTGNANACPAPIKACQ